MTTVVLSPVNAWTQFFGGNTASSAPNIPLAGGMLNIYAAGTTTPVTTYTSNTGLIANTNPIVLDSAGRLPGVEIWWPAGSSYKAVLMDASGNVIPNGTWDNIPGINDPTLVAAPATAITYTPPGTGAVSTTVAAKLGQWINPRDYGADPTGVADSTTALTNAIAAAGIGGTVAISYGDKYLINSNLTINNNVSILGPNSFVGTMTSNSESASYASLGGALILNSAATITVNAGASIKGFLIYCSGMTFPATDSSSFAGTAITIGGDDATISDCMILGFVQGITSNGFQRLSCIDVRGDNVAGIYINNSQDTARIVRCHMWPFAVFRAGVTAAQMQRSGAAYKIDSSNDWAIFDKCLSYGYATGFIANSSDSVTFLMCEADNTALGFGVGFQATGTCVDLLFQSCRAAAQIQGFQISMTAGAGVIARVAECTAWGNTTHGLLVAAASGGDCQIMGGEFRNNPNHISIASATPLVDIDNVRFDTSSIIYNISVSTTNVRIGAFNNYGGLAAGGQPVGTVANAAVPSVASASAISLPPNATDVIITGTTGIGTINAGWAGRVVTLYFSAALSVFSSTGAANAVKLNSGATFTAAANSTLTIRHNGVQWFEIGRNA